MKTWPEAHEAYKWLTESQGYAQILAAFGEDADNGANLLFCADRLCIIADIMRERASAAMEKPQ